VDTKNREEMINFLKNHFRYDTMNSWNMSSSYANNVKIYDLGLDREIEMKLYQMIYIDDFYEPINSIIREFNERHNYEYQIGFNGRSGGYLVLYRGGRQDDRVFVKAGQSIDRGEDFEDWENYELERRVGLIQDFDQTCDEIVEYAANEAKTKDIVEEEVVITKKIKKIK
jgi:hypothetical protein